MPFWRSSSKPSKKTLKSKSKSISKIKAFRCPPPAFPRTSTSIPTRKNVCSTDTTTSTICSASKTRSQPGKRPHNKHLPSGKIFFGGDSEKAFPLTNIQNLQKAKHEPHRSNGYHPARRGTNHRGIIQRSRKAGHRPPLARRAESQPPRSGLGKGLGRGIQSRSAHHPVGRQKQLSRQNRNPRFCRRRGLPQLDRSSRWQGPEPADQRLAQARTKSASKNTRTAPGRHPGRTGRSRKTRHHRQRLPRGLVQRHAQLPRLHLFYGRCPQQNQGKTHHAARHPRHFQSRPDLGDL